MSKKDEFQSALTEFAKDIQSKVCTPDGQWTVKGFIDTFRNIYTISADTKIVSKVLEIHLFPELLAFPRSMDIDWWWPLIRIKNYYPDISFVGADDESVKFAVDFKTTYRKRGKPWLCNGFTLGSHGKYFQERTSTKNIQFPYNSYAGHFCLG